ncbi:unnamed protein product [Staurois parvus]|uniref:Uncharacterized protein n=1 Tax=Staurois parvus TaxID=386267 RepID=A0ABN9B053_9NEOB|nr:unnamed protein product [Staurois parvus]
MRIGDSGNRRQSTPEQGSWATGARATGGNLPLGRGLGQQAVTYHRAGASGNRRQPTPRQGSRGLNRTLAVESGNSTAPTQLSRVIGFTGTQ